MYGRWASYAINFPTENCLGEAPTKNSSNTRSKILDFPSTTNTHLHNSSTLFNVAWIKTLQQEFLWKKLLFIPGWSKLKTFSTEIAFLTIPVFAKNKTQCLLTKSRSGICILIPVQIYWEQKMPIFWSIIVFMKKERKKPKIRWEKIWQTNTVLNLRFPLLLLRFFPR